MPVATTIKTTKLFKRYIDDVVFLSETLDVTDNVKRRLKCAFEKQHLKLVFREMSTKNYGDDLELLDVNHVIDKTEIGGFYVKNYIKPTAENRVFVNGKSHHPHSVYKSIVFRESIRLRRLCEHDSDYLEAIKSLKDKCLKSCFCKALVDNMIYITAEWNYRFGPPMKKARENNENISVWTTSYKIQAHENSVAVGGSHPCGKCLLCNRGGVGGMVKKTKLIESKSGKTIELKKNFNCKNLGIYAAKCNVCGEHYFYIQKYHYNVKNRLPFKNLVLYTVLNYFVIIYFLTLIYFVA